MKEEVKSVQVCCNILASCDLGRIVVIQSAVCVAKVTSYRNWSVGHYCVTLGEVFV